MFNESKYTCWYHGIVDGAKSQNRCKKNGYYENHHILPKSLGGDNGKNNRVLLTAREHFICHLLLTKMTTGAAKRNMSYALSIMTSKHRYSPRASRLYELVKKSASTARKEYWDEIKKDPIAYAAKCEINRQSQIGKSLSEDHKSKLKLKSELAGAKYVIESPIGEIFSPLNLAAFCRERGIDHRVIKQSFRGGKNDCRVQRGASAGWKILEKK